MKVLVNGVVGSDRVWEHPMMVQARWLVWLNSGSKACGVRIERKLDRWVMGRQISEDRQGSPMTSPFVSYSRSAVRAWVATEDEDRVTTAVLVPVGGKLERKLMCWMVSPGAALEMGSEPKRA